MTVKEYTDICKKFSDETRKWADVLRGAFYTTEGTDNWAETPDNAHGGIDVRWAFKLSKKEIEKEAPQRFINNLLDLIHLAVDDEWDLQQLEWGIKNFE